MNSHDELAFLRSPLKLSPDVFTPLTRTPWAGRDIARRYKNTIAGVTPDIAIGESWDFSCDPAFPSRVTGRRETLSQLVELYPREILGDSSSGKSVCEILVKLLNAAEPLSVQVHPADDDPSLKPGECGKPESWLVLDADPGCGLYLGFSRSISREALRAALLAGDSAKELLHFVPVRPGDYFEIAPGVSHAIGPGVTLLEPQRILHGQSGKTYRLWDWGRKYDAHGRLDMTHGQPRDLHLDASLRLIDPLTQVGDDFVATTRRSGDVSSPVPHVSWSQYPANAYYQVHRVTTRQPARFTLTIANGYGAMIMFGGAVQIAGPDTTLQGKMVLISKGEPALLPRASNPMRVEVGHDADFAVIIPAGARLDIAP